MYNVATNRWTDTGGFGKSLVLGKDAAGKDREVTLRPISFVLALMISHASRPTLRNRCGSWLAK